MLETGPVRWGIMGTAAVARRSFVPAVRQAGGIVVAVASRQMSRASKYAAELGIEYAVQGYHRLIEDPIVDALYIPLPNALHAEWTIRGLVAGKPVLCEKPLCVSLPETEQVLAVARKTGTLLWEAFVFPFSAQMAQVRALMDDGAIGELREIQSSFHISLTSHADIRMQPGLAGGALRDVGSYPVRLAGELLASNHDSAWATAEWDGDGVDVETQGSLGYPDGERLLLSCGFRRGRDRFTRLLGTAGQIHVTNMFHPGPDEVVEVRSVGKGPANYRAGGSELPFTAAIRHIHAVLRGEVPPLFLAVETSLRTARALNDLRAQLPVRCG